MTVGLFSGRGVGFGFGAGCGFGIGFGFGGAPLHILGMGVGGGCGIGLGIGWGFGLAYGARYIDSRPRFRSLDYGRHDVQAEDDVVESGKELSKT